MKHELIIRELLDSAKNLKYEIEKLKETLDDIKKDIIQNKKNFSLDRQFSIINLPSQGKLYPGGKSSLLVRYLTSIEENILMDPMLMESGKGLEIVLKSVVIDDINPYDLLLSDFQAILIFLRSTAYGDTITLKFECPECKKENDFDLHLSKLNFKENKDEPNENGEFVLVLPRSKYEVILRPLTFAQQMSAVKECENEKMTIYDGEIAIEIKRENTIKLLSYIKSVNGVEDKFKIKNAIKKIPKSDSGFLGDFIKRNESGIDSTIKCNCEFCSNETEQTIDFGYNLLSLPDNYQKQMLEEQFLITYYGKGISMEDAMRMPIFKRRWHINRISEEINKQNEAEKQAMSKAKSKR